MDIGHSVVGEQRVTAGSVKKIKSFDRFKGGFFQDLGAAVTRYGEKLEDGFARCGREHNEEPRTPTTHGSICTCHPSSRYGFNAIRTRRGAYVRSFRAMAA